MAPELAVRREDRLEVGVEALVEGSQEGGQLGVHSGWTDSSMAVTI